MAGGKLISTGVEFPDATTQTTSGLPLAGGALTGAVTTTSTFDGRDVAADGVTADAALPKAGGTMTGTIAGFTSTGIDDNATSTAITIDSGETVSVANSLSLGDTNASPSILLTANGAARASIDYDNASGTVTADNTYGPVVIKTGSVGTSTAKLTVEAAGDVTVENGNLVVGTSGKGIDFSADANASGMTSELLDDYEEGTWTPIPARISTPITTTGTITASGRYTKIGRQVYISGSITIDGTITQGANVCTALGLPFTPETDAGDRYSNQVTWDKDGQTALTALNILYVGSYTDSLYTAVIFGASGPSWAAGTVKFSATYKTAT